MSKILINDKITRAVGRVSLVLLGCLGLTLLCPLTFNGAEAVDLEPGQSIATATMQTRVLVQSAISLALQNRVSMDIIPTSDGTFAASTVNLNVETNNSTGYGIYMSTLDGNRNLTLVGNTNPETAAIEPLQAETSETNFPTNRWGYRLANKTETSGNSYRAVPGETTSIRNVTYVNPTSGQRDSYELSFGVKVGTNLLAGTYSNQVVVSVVANPRELQGLADMTYMQEMTPELCQALKDLPADQQTGQLIDIRDQNSYWVSYLADNNCWMTQNLALDLTKDEALTPADTDLTVNWTVPTSTEKSVPSTATGNNAATRSWNLGEYVLAVPQRNIKCTNGAGDGNSSISSTQTLDRCTDFQKVDDSWTYAPAYQGTWNGYTGLVAVDKTNKTYDSHYLIGNYYQWTAATAASSNAAASICPKGWKLPTQPQYTTLVTTYKISSNAAGVKLLLSAPLNFISNGFIDTEFGSLRVAGDSGYYWSSTTFNATNAYDLAFDTSNVYPAFNNARYLGFSVRCIAR